MQMDSNPNKAGTPRLQLQKNQFGFTIGGPLLVPVFYTGINWTFYFLVYEGLQKVGSFSSFTGTVP